MTASQNNDDLKSDHLQFKQAETYLKVINRFAVNVSTLNTIHDIVWEVAKYAIARLEFEDCVVYLKDESGERLIQVASHGPKNPIHYEIKDPITIKVGEGIVGSVAQTGLTERISDTLHDPRYIIDDQFRRSEIAVPIIHEEIILGVIDSEHHQPSFYTPEHEEILKTIASLIAPRIAYIQATQSEIAHSEKQLLVRTKELKAALFSLQNAQKELIVAKEAAEAASQAKTAFISKMSHELRSPLTSILGYSQLLERYGVGNEKILKAASIIEDGGKHLLTLINDILTFSKLEADTYTMEAKFIPFRPFLENIGQLVQVQAKNKNLKFALELAGSVPQSIFVDSNRLRQVLLNLIVNGIKFCDEGSVKLCVMPLELNEEGIATIRFEVIDTGIGIAKEDQDKIFLPFEQLKQKGSTSIGTGLGLAIAQQIVTSMNSKILVESVLGQGSRFLFDVELPFSNQLKRMQTSQLKRQIVGYQGAKKTILVAEDTVSIRTFLSHTLSMLGFTVIEVENGNEAIKSLQTLRPDLIFMDTLMPIMGGVEATKKIRKIPAFAHLPIIAISAHVNQEEIDKLIDNGADRFLAKPIFINEMLETLDQLIDVEWVFE